MTVKNFVVRENWVGSEVTSTKIAFFVIFEPTWIHNLAPNSLKMDFLKHNCNFQSIRKREAILLPII